MEGLPVTIRLLDPPLHEFLPHSEKEKIEVLRNAKSKWDRFHPEKLSSSAVAAAASASTPSNGNGGSSGRAAAASAEAVSLLRKALCLDPRDVDCWHLLGWLLHTVYRDAPAAERCYRAALRACDVDGNGAIDYNEFVAALSQSNKINPELGA